MKKIEELVKQGEVLEIDGKKYSSEKLYRVFDEPLARTVVVNSLTGFVDFIERNVDDLDLASRYIAWAESFDSVSLVSRLTELSREREKLLTAKLDDYFESFPFGEFLGQEDFLIKLHSLFEKKEGDDFDYVSEMVSKIVQANSADTEDDGITQRVTIKKGVSGALSEKGTVKHIVRLSPYRTFREIEQPESQFFAKDKNQ